MLKLIALLGGAAGVVGFFLPLAEYRDHAGQVTRTPSAYEIATTPRDASGLADFAKGLGASEDQADRLEEAANQTLLVSRGTIIAFYIPAALLALLALFNLIRGRFGRITALLAMVLGAANAGVFGYLYITHQRSADATTALGTGVWLLGVAGAGGLLAGLFAMFAPDDD